MMMKDLSDVKITKTKKVGKIKMTMEMVGEKAHNKMIKTKIFWSTDLRDTSANSFRSLGQF